VRIGRAANDAMLAADELQRVPASRDRADELLRQATEHLVTARGAADRDTAGFAAGTRTTLDRAGATQQANGPESRVNLTLACKQHTDSPVMFVLFELAQ
jgi:hypothetical protein